MKTKIQLPISRNVIKKIKTFTIIFVICAVFTSSTELYHFSALIEVKAQETKKPDYKEEPSQQDLTNVQLDYELINKRDPYTKHLKKIDGTYEMTVYNEVVQYKENGKFKEIDNSLIYDDAYNHYENKANDYKLKLQKKINDNKKFKLNLNYSRQF